MKKITDKTILKERKTYHKPFIVKMGIVGTLGGKAKNATEASKLGKIS